MTNATIAACARTWLGTRFHHQGRLKKNERHKGGVDCLGLLVGIAQELQLLQPNGEPIIALDEIDYSHYPDTDHMRSKLVQALCEIAIHEIRPNDILLFKIDDHPQHLAIVCDGGNGLGIIHAYAPAKAVVEHHLDSWWRAHIEAAFRYQ